MKVAKIIPINDTQAVAVNERGEEQLVEFKAIDSTFYNKAPLKGRVSKDGVISLLSRSDRALDELEALLISLDSYLVDRFLSGYFDEDEEAKEDVRKALRILDIARDKIDTIQRDVNTSSFLLLALKDENE